MSPFLKITFVKPALILFISSLEISKKSILEYQTINDSKGLANNWMLNGMNLEKSGDYNEALALYEKVVRTCELFGYDNLLINVRANQANLIFRKGN